jgi:hypothetical protein
MADTAIKPIMLELAACLCAELADDTLCYCDVLAGMGVPIGDVTECGGVAYVRLVSVFPSTNFPSPDVTDGCTSLIAFVLAVGVIRPAPQMDETGNFDPADVAQASLKALDDIAAIRTAIRCCLRNKYEDVQNVMNEWSPIEDDSVVGGEWLLTVQEAF